MIYIQLFLSFFQIGALSIGGGYAAMPLIQQQVVELHHWISMTAFTDIVTIAEMTPGPIAINAATFVGTQMAGPTGAIVATLGCITPSCIIVMTLAWVYYKYKELTIVQGTLNGLRPAVVAMIASAGLSILLLAIWNAGKLPVHFADTNIISLGIFIGCFFVMRKWKPNPIYTLIGAGVAGVLFYYIIGL